MIDLKEVRDMFQWKCAFNVNGKRTEQIVNAYNSTDARKLIEAQYSGAKITWINVLRV